MADSGSNKMKVYWFPFYRSTRVVWLIKEMGVEDEFEMIKYKPNSDPPKDAVYRKDVHPLGTIPALLVPGRPTLLESGAICMYLADKYGKCVPDAKDRADYYDFIMFGNSTLDELMEFYFALWSLNTEYSEEKQKTMKDKFDACMTYLAKRLEGRQYVCGDTLTAADCVVGYDLLLTADFFKDGELLKKHPKILEYYGRLKARPAFQATISMQ